jgi:hypothetical protein
VRRAHAGHTAAQNDNFCCHFFETILSSRFGFIRRHLPAIVLI